MMAKSMSTRSTVSSVIFFTLCAILRLLVSGASAAHPESEAASASDLICHTDKASDCYPRIFQATEEFQTVHDDQELPSGLHVRLNIWTGQKEAKINVPDEVDPSLEGLGSQQGVVVVDSGEPEEAPLPKGAPQYEPVGKIKESQQDAGLFMEALKVLKTGLADSDEMFDTALDSLETISHDIYYGLKIAEDPEVLKALFCLSADQGAPSINGATPRDQQAAAVIAGALQNNPAALKEVVKVWPALMSSNCPAKGASLASEFYSSFVPNDIPASESQQWAKKAKAKVAAINGLIKDDGIRMEFLAQNGMERLLEVLIPEDDAWSVTQRKTGLLVLDNFLDENMGAKLGQWPRATKLSDQECQALESRTKEGCWDYHVARIMKANRGDKEHWSKELHERLIKARKDTKPATGRDEL